jgi:ankyrin repeat protein
MDTVMVLLDYGADPAAVDIDGKTAGRLALYEGYSMVASLLLILESNPISDE